MIASKQDFKLTGKSLKVPWLQIVDQLTAVESLSSAN